MSSHLSAFPAFRQALAGAVTALPADLVDICPPGCRNNLRWQLGHIIFTAERLILGLAGEPKSFPDTWQPWFGNGSSPETWTEETPDWAGLLKALEVSTPHLLTWLEGADPERPLAEPFRPGRLPILCDTVGTAVAMAIWHEGFHFGQVASYRNLLAGKAAA